ncbi:hypothetical protein MAR_029049 [Mya arenaria]|uniref:Uncharacterized protein n=1 Tax=Mya arenaria TaxID=6604 RepID=A0ABY7DF93_MYAAR|nr:hypothetical protein MAR_029049 [Mya arenaria]
MFNVDSPDNLKCAICCLELTVNMFCRLDCADFGYYCYHHWCSGIPHLQTTKTCLCFHSNSQLYHRTPTNYHGTPLNYNRTAKNYHRFSTEPTQPTMDHQENQELSRTRTLTN